jgi:hypothetical protein
MGFEDLGLFYVPIFILGLGLMDNKSLFRIYNGIHLEAVV